MMNEVGSYPQNTCAEILKLCTYIRLSLMSSKVCRVIHKTVFEKYGHHYLRHQNKKNSPSNQNNACFQWPKVGFFLLVALKAAVWLQVIIMLSIV